MVELQDTPIIWYDGWVDSSVDYILMAEGWSHTFSICVRPIQQHTEEACEQMHVDLIRSWDC